MASSTQGFGQGLRLACLTAVAAVCSFSPLAAQEIQQYKDFDRYRYVPQLPTGPGNPPSLPDSPRDVTGDSTPLVGELKGLVFVSDPELVSTDKIDMPGLHVHSGDLGMLESQAFHSVVAPYFGQPVSVLSLNEMVRDIILFYRANDRPVVDVSVPEQDITDGTVQIIVLEGRAGRVRVEGARYFNPCVLVDQVFIDPGDPIYESCLMEDLRWLYRDPFRTVRVELTPGEQRGLTDVIFKVEDRLPARIFAGYEDTGNQALGLERTFYGFNLNNVFDRDDDASYQFTTGSDFDSLEAHSVFYSTALANRDLLMFYGNYADFRTNFGGLDQNGFTWQTLFRWYRELDRIGSYEHAIQAGFDYKRTNTNLDLGGIAVFDTTADVVQMMIGYQAQDYDDYGNTLFGVDLFYSPGGIGGRNDKATYNEIRPGADPGYVYTRAYWQRTQDLQADLQFVARVTGQLAEGNLIQTEQLGLGGYSSIRGYDFYSVLGDSGYFANLELWSPTFHLHECEADSLRFLAFYDVGNLYNHTQLPGEPNTVFLSGAGVGMRYQYSDMVSLRLDYGWKLQDFAFQDDSRFHIGAVISR